MAQYKKNFSLPNNTNFSLIKDYFFFKKSCYIIAVISEISTFWECPKSPFSLLRWWNVLYSNCVVNAIISFWHWNCQQKAKSHCRKNQPSGGFLTSYFLWFNIEEQHSLDIWKCKFFCEKDNDKTYLPRGLNCVNFCSIVLNL